MAVYMSTARQRRRTLAVAVGALLLGVILGALIGRATASDVNDALNASRSRGRELAAALHALPLEYEQARSGSGENQAGIEDAAKRVADQADSAVAKAPWLSGSDRIKVTLGVGVVVDAAHRGVSISEFQHAVDLAASIVEDVFGVRT